MQRVIISFQTSGESVVCRKILHSFLLQIFRVIFSLDNPFIMEKSEKWTKIVGNSEIVGNYKSWDGWGFGMVPKRSLPWLPAAATAQLPGSPPWLIPWLYLSQSTWQTSPHQCNPGPQHSFATILNLTPYNLILLENCPDTKNILSTCVNDPFW